MYMWRLQSNVCSVVVQMMVPALLLLLLQALHLISYLLKNECWCQGPVTILQDLDTHRLGADMSFIYFPRPSWQTGNWMCPSPRIKAPPSVTIKMLRLGRRRSEMDSAIGHHTPKLGGRPWTSSKIRFPPRRRIISFPGSWAKTWSKLVFLFQHAQWHYCIVGACGPSWNATHGDTGCTGPLPICGVFSPTQRSQKWRA